ncbi:MAG: GTP cyclohydrolase FolE2 [Candidatus Cloacimonetes bacterium]|nr:GTP cyclohydrolase FolE2 [Candidatus Cloacimonadota bacterium]
MINIPDLQSQGDSRRIGIDKVGVKGIRYPIVVDDRANGVQASIGEFNIYVDLHHSKRGTHMSRFLEVLNRYHQDSIISQLDKLLLELKSVLKADAAYIDIVFPYFVKKQAPVSGIASLMDYQCFFNASYAERFELWIGTVVPVTALCPCSREISDAGAHNQRSLVTIKCRYRDFVWLEELIGIAEAASSCPVYPLLKRRDEKYVTEAAYARPRFVEDIVREVTQKLGSDPRVLEFYVEADSFESIHNHNAYAMVYRPARG